MSVYLSYVVCILCLLLCVCVCLLIMLKEKSKLSVNSFFSCDFCTKSLYVCMYVLLHINVAGCHF